MAGNRQDELLPRLRRMVYSLFAVYWIMVAACLVFPRMAGDPGESVAGITLVGITFLILLLVALSVSLSLAYFSVKHRHTLAMSDLVMGLVPIAFSLIALVSLWLGGS